VTSFDGAASFGASFTPVVAAGALVSFSLASFVPVVAAGVFASLAGGGLGALAFDAGSALVDGISSEGFFPSPRMLLLERAVFYFPGSPTSAEGPSGCSTTFLGFFFGGGLSGDSSCF